MAFSFLVPQSRAHLQAYLFKGLGFVMVIALIMSSTSLRPVQAASSLSIYNDSLATGWSNWSWNAGVNLASTDSVYDGKNSLALSVWGGWAGLYLHSEKAISTSPYTSLSFTLKTDQKKDQFGVYLIDANYQAIKAGIPLADYSSEDAGQDWKHYTIPLSDLAGANTTINGLVIQENSGNWQPTVFLDDLELTTSSGTTATLEPSSTPVASPTASQIPTPIATPPAALPSAATATPLVDNQYEIYDSSLHSGWSNWSWNSGLAFNKTITFTPWGGWAGLYLHADTAVTTATYSSLTFSSNFSRADEQFGVALYGTNGQVITSPVPISKYIVSTSNGWNYYAVPLADLGVRGGDITGLLIQEITGNAQPSILLSDIALITNTSPSSAVTSKTSAPSVTLASSTPTQTGYTTQNNQLYKDGAEITLKGVNWFGTETGSHVVGGLGSRNWQDEISQMKSLGFNAVRIPVCPASLHGVAVSGVDYTKNPDLKGLDSAGVLDKVVQELNAQQMYILLDHHTTDCQGISDLWYTASYSEAMWISDLTNLASRYKDLAYFMGIDLKNEPHGYATWGTGVVSTDWNLAAERAGKAVLQANPSLLIFIEGIQSSSTCSSATSHWWGGNLEPAACKGIDPTSIPLNKQIFAPHVYGPDVYMQPYFSAADFPSNMPQIWDQQFGFLASNGTTVIPGEWGGRYGTGGGTSIDTTWQNTLVNYMSSKGICNSFYWSWNPDSSDTGGVLQNDWQTPWQSKVDLLKQYHNTCSQ